MTGINEWIIGMAAAGLAFGALAADPDYPSKPIRVIVPYPAGGNADNIARVYTKKLSEIIGTPVIVENKPGASGTIGADSVAKAAPDGYTLLLTPTTQLTSTGLNVKPNYDGVRDFTPVAGLVIAPLVFVVPATSPAKSVKDLEALTKTKQMGYGSYGTGTSTHIMQHQLGKQFGAKDLVHVPYKGEAPMIADMLGGQIHMGLVSVGVARSMEQSGKLRALALVGPTRSKFLPKVPTFQEQGYRNLDWTYGVAVYAPVKVPADILEKLRAASQKVIASPDVQKSYLAQSNQSWTVDPVELQKRMVIDSVLWNKVLSEIGKIE